MGGSKEYTGAPYYAASSALRSGADLAHIFTPDESALIPIKCYSPEIIVHLAEKPADVIKWLPSMHALVVGPGLGRDPNLETYLIELFTEILIEFKNLPVILDADALYWLCNSDRFSDLVKSTNIILTPNAAEYSRLLTWSKTKNLKDLCRDLKNSIII